MELTPSAPFHPSIDFVLSYTNLLAKYDAPNLMYVVRYFCAKHL